MKRFQGDGSSWGTGKVWKPCRGGVERRENPGSVKGDGVETGDFTGFDISALRV